MENSFYDVSFEVGQTKTIVNAHKAILAARCEYFRSIFNGVKETTAKSNLPISLPFIDVETFEQVRRKAVQVNNQHAK